MSFHNSENVPHKTNQKIDLFSHREAYCLPPSKPTFSCYKIKLLTSHAVSGIIFIFLLPAYWWV